MPDHPVPVANGFSAPLLLATLLAALIPPFLILDPFPTHAVKLHLVEGEPDAGVPPLARPVRRRAGRVRHGNVSYPHPEPGRITLPLAVMADGTLRLGGEPLRPAELETRLHALAPADGHWVDLRPHPEARYEVVLDVIALIARIGFDRLEFDSRPFADAIDRQPS